MATKANTTSFRNASLPAKWRWSDDSQSETHFSTKNYIDLCDLMLEPSFEFISEILTQAGYVEEQDRGTIIRRLQNLKPDGKLYLNGVTICFRIKSNAACINKILEDGKSPGDILDYFGIKAVGETAEDVGRLRTAAISMSNITSRKCEFSYPSKECYVSHKSRHLIENSGHKMKLEFLITHADFEVVEPQTHIMIDQEREIRRQLKGLSNFDKPRKMELATRLEEKISQRTKLNFQTFIEAGLKRLCAADAIIPVPVSILESYALSGVYNSARSITAKFTPATLPCILETSNSNSDAQLKLNLA